MVPLWTHYGLAMVVGRSMQPTFQSGDLLVVDKLAYQHADPKRGEIVLVLFHGELMVKRVVGLPGEEIEVRQGVLLVNGAAVKEQHMMERGPLDIAAGRLFSGKYAVLGDNRTTWPSQTIHAVVTKDQFLGRVLSAYPTAVRGATAPLLRLVPKQLASTSEAMP
jgi:signal peptidase I